MGTCQFKGASSFMILEVLVEPDPRLHKVASPVETIDDDILKALDDMAETMYANQGIGLAATQVNILKRMMVVDVGWDPEKGASSQKSLKLINPEIIWKADEEAVLKEGCLSVPGQYADVIRPSQVKVRYLDTEGKNQEIEASGLLSACLQHEIDHLDGIVFLQHLSALRREMLMKKLLKSQRAEHTHAH